MSQKIKKWVPLIMAALLVAAPMTGCTTGYRSDNIARTRTGTVPQSYLGTTRNNVNNLTPTPYNQVGYNPRIGNMGAETNRYPGTTTGIGTTGIGTGNLGTGTPGVVQPNNLVGTDGLRNTTISGPLPHTVSTAGDNRRAENIHNALSRMTNITDVSVTLSGDTAYVSCRPANMARTDINTLRANLAAEIKRLDSSIRNVSVTEKTGYLMQNKGGAPATTPITTPTITPTIPQRSTTTNLGTGLTKSGTNIINNAKNTLDTMDRRVKNVMPSVK